MFDLYSAWGTRYVPEVHHTWMTLELPSSLVTTQVMGRSWLLVNARFRSPVTTAWVILATQRPY